MNSHDYLPLCRSLSFSFTVCLSPCLALTLPCLPVAMTARQLDECVCLFMWWQAGMGGWIHIWLVCGRGKDVIRVCVWSWRPVYPHWDFWQLLSAAVSWWWCNAGGNERGVWCSAAEPTHFFKSTDLIKSPAADTQPETQTTRGQKDSTENEWISKWKSSRSMFI